MENKNNHEYIAHKAEDGRNHTIFEHSEGVANLAKEFGDSFGVGDLAYYTGLCHDIGKYSAEFQKRINGDGPKVDHSTAGAYECLKGGHIYAAFAIAGHHSGLLDVGSQTDTEGTFWGRIYKALNKMIPSYDEWEKEIVLPKLRQDKETEINENEMMFFTRMLYSCLVDADYLDTERFIKGEARNPTYPSMDMLWEKLIAYTSDWFPPKNKLNEQRCKILCECINQGNNQNQGLFTLTVPTGGGKTIASLAFAIAQARKNNMKRIIYVVPYTSIIEQTADEFRKIFGDEYVLEHHSGVAYDIGEDATMQTIKLAQATENWDMPIIVTTNVQFFESLYSNKSSKCRKLHNIANSVVIFDEAQMIPLTYTKPCVYAITQLVKNYNVSAILCTATQPAFESIIEEYLPKAKITELCPAEDIDTDVFKRTKYVNKGEMKLEEVAEEMNSLPQVLCVVNSRKNAVELYEMLEGEDNFHLTTLMTPNHRRKTLDEIRRRLKNGEPCRVVSTSLIEAGVDIDFPKVYRELAGLDSILQSAGRCNREGKRSSDESIVTIFKCENKSPQNLNTLISACETIIKNNEEIDSREAIHKYYCELYELKGKEALDRDQILVENKQERFAFEKIANKFELIDNETKTIYIPVNDEAQQLINELRNEEYSKSLFRKLNQYAVNVYPNHFHELENAGVIDVIDDSKAILINMDLYSNRTGLSMSADSGQALFN